MAKVLLPLKFNIKHKIKHHRIKHEMGGKYGINISFLYMHIQPVYGILVSMTCSL